MFEAIFIIALVFLIIGSITDIKTREVPDWVNYSGIVVGFGWRGLYSVAQWNYIYILEGVLGFAVFFAVACALYYLGQWGGGDSKMLMALGTMIGLGLTLDSFMVGFFVNLLFVGGVYGLFWSLGLVFVHWKGVHKELEKYHKDKHVKILRGATYLVSLAVIILSLLADELRLALLCIAALLMALYHLWLLIKAVEARGMIKRRAVSELTEGDWVVHEIKHKGKYICGPKDLGLSKAQIRKLKKYNVNSITIKEGIPFIPSFLITFIVTYLWGNLIMYIL